MDLSISQALQDFREEVKVFLQDNLTPEFIRAGKRATSVFPDYEASMKWQKVLNEKGWVVPGWPKQYGGADWSIEQVSIFQEECIKANAPALYPMGIQMLGPVLMHYGTDAQKAELLPKMLSGEDFWCQGYSEPGAGSDLASLQTRAVSDGEDYIVNGSKIWTTAAQHANKMFCLVRTDAECKPQRGITFILIDMDSPGISVDPIVSMDGEVEQCQVFFDDVRVPKVNRIGEENDGWSVAKFLLEFERGGSSFNIFVESQLAAIYDLADEQRQAYGVSAADDPVVASQLAELEIDSLALKFLEYRITAAAAGGGNPGALASMQKIVGSELSQKVDELSLEMQGAYVAVKQNESLKPSFTDETIGCESGIKMMNHYLNNRASTIFGGTSEIQRNIIAKLVLGL
ncbi:acyl-CoA dehydrogenase family protein [Maricurvus nonylphenolicus]|uniref:acyl-CoA dehydrogenase family protein n=1 Tax=Maricurvus nonylphenolicus TaxID=1008307 RepID=UPI0036F3D85D